MNIVKPPYRGTLTLSNGTEVHSYTGAVTYQSATYLKESGALTSVKSIPWPPAIGSIAPINKFDYTYSLETHRKGVLGGWSDYYQRWTGYKGYVTDKVGGTEQAWPSPLPASALAKARGKVLDKLKDQSVNLAQAYAERKQTVNMLIKTTNRVASAAMAIRRGKLRHAADLLGIKGTKANVFKDIKPSRDNLANHWLEYSYGWRPLLSDIHGSCELLAKTFLKNAPVKVYANAREEYKYIGTKKEDSSYRERYEGLVTVHSRIVVWYAMENDFAQKMASTGVTNPALLAWELLPYSFVVDWFLPVGNYLKRIDSTMGLTFRYGSESYRIESGFTTHIGKTPNASPTATASGGRNYTSTVKKRVKLTSFPRNEFGVAGDFGADKALSGIALLNQLFGRKS